MVIETPQGDAIAIRHMMFLSMSYDHRVVDGNGISLWSFNNCRFFTDCSNCHNCYLRLINNWSSHHIPESTHIGYGESSTLNFVRLKFIGTGTVSKIVY